MNEEVILKVQQLKKTFPVKAGTFSNRVLTLKAVDGVSFEVRRGETLGLVGESGCGKTTVGRCILRLYDPEEGRIFLDPEGAVVDEAAALDEKRRALENELREMDEISAIDRRKSRSALKGEIRRLKREADDLAGNSDILVMDRRSLKRCRRKIQMIFQDPWASLNPHMVVKDIIGEGPREFGTHAGSALNALVRDLLDRVGLPSAASNRYPHEFSGGQRQRICIARALATNPSLIVCDEPVSALDLSIQAQILNLLIDLQEDFGLSLLFVAHDLSVVEYMSDRIVVMYLGRIVEEAASSQLYRNPRHPYTQSLLSAIPAADPEVNVQPEVLEGDVPSPVHPPRGCSFHTRCRYRTDICAEVRPVLEKEREGHRIACHNPPSG